MADDGCAVCGKPLVPGRDTRWQHQGKWYYFHAAGCRMLFIGNPEQYLSAKA